MLLILLYCITGFHILLIPCIRIVYKYKHGKKKSTTEEYAFSILNLYAMALLTCLPLPFYNVLMSFAFCDNTQPIMRNFVCYEGIYYLHFSTAVLGMILLSIFSVICNLIYIRTSPCSTAPFASPPTKLNIIKWVYKVAIMLFYTISQDGHLG
jgi:hypothetical protein